ncbi:MAG: sirohydrochlorin chelatase [Actinobacteria bacterium]|nr:sirohydrochlorin chelatase [Actinomycetota bacterium]
MEADPPVLVGCGHGTRDPAGRRALARLRLDVAALRPGLRVVAANIDVHKPALPDVVARLTGAGRRCVVVPLLLSAGYHLRVDVAAAVRAGGGLAVAAPALGPDAALVDVLGERLAECGAGDDDLVVLAAAGSSDARAAVDVAAVAAALAERRGGSVRAAFLSAARPTVAEAVRSAGAVRSGGSVRSVGSVRRPVTVASYLLAPGLFHARLATLGAVRVSPPMAPHPLLAELALRRYDAAARAAGW